MQLPTTKPVLQVVLPSPSRGSSRGRIPIHCSTGLQHSLDCEASRRACLSTVLGLSLTACMRTPATAAVVDEDVAQRVFDAAGEVCFPQLPGVKRTWYQQEVVNKGCDVMGAAAQSVVSISDFRQDASGARVAEGTGSGVVWDRSVLPCHRGSQCKRQPEAVFS